jgi:DNA-binding transcriptional MerR regulator
MPTAKRKHAKAQEEVVIPEKIYFRIGEVSALANLPTYVLRFWETEFSQLKPTKSSTGQRMYRRKDVEYVMQIRRLLYEDGFTIAGAREKLREEMRSSRSHEQTENADFLPALDKSLNEPPDESPENEPQDESPDALPLLSPVNSTKNKEALQRLRQRLCEVLDLLS